MFCCVCVLGQESLVNGNALVISLLAVSGLLCCLLTVIIWMQPESKTKLSFKVTIVTLSGNLLSWSLFLPYFHSIRWPRSRAPSLDLLRISQDCRWAIWAHIKEGTRQLKMKPWDAYRDIGLFAYYDFMIPYRLCNQPTPLFCFGKSFFLSIFVMQKRFSQIPTNRLLILHPEM